MDLAEFPILRRVLPHTGRLDGDDTGYRDVAVSPLDAEDPDPMVSLDGIVACYPVYAHGARAGITPWYGTGLGASEQVLVRQPVAHALRRANELLLGHGRKLLVLDGWRPARVQARLWAEVFVRLRAERRVLSVLDTVQLGRAADDTASYCRVMAGPEQERAVERVLALQRADLEAAALVLGGDAGAVAREYLTYQANLGAVALPLDRRANTAHGSGGAVDLWLLDTSTGAPTSLGVPFDSTSPAAVMDWFEWASPEAYEDLWARDEALRGYLAELGVERPGLGEAFAAARGERRLLHGALIAVGATYFSLDRECGEPWHFNLGNEAGGRQAALLPGAGNACHSLLKNVRDGATGVPMAVWGNEQAHRLGGEG